MDILCGIIARALHIHYTMSRETIYVEGIVPNSVSNSDKMSVPSIAFTYWASHIFCPCISNKLSDTRNQFNMEENISQ